MTEQQPPSDDEGLPEEEAPQGVPEVGGTEPEDEDEDTTEEPTEEESA